MEGWIRRSKNVFSTEEERERDGEGEVKQVWGRKNGEDDRKE